MYARAGTALALSRGMLSFILAAVLSSTVSVDVNRASLEQLTDLPGVGPVIAARIVERRKKRPFRRAEELLQVRGIGAKTLARFKPRVVLAPIP